MKVKVGQLEGLFRALVKLSKVPTPEIGARQAYWIGKEMEKVRSNLRHREEMRTKFVMDFGKEDTIVDDKGDEKGSGSFRVLPERLPNFVRAMADMDMEEVQDGFKLQFTFSELSQIKGLTGEDFEALMPLIVEEVAEIKAEATA